MNGRKLKLLTQVSIDGHLADATGKTDWMIWNWGPIWSWDNELQKWFTDLTLSIGAILLSRKMAEEGFISYWKRVSEIPGDPQRTFASKIVHTPKVVFSKTLKQDDVRRHAWENTTLANGHVSDEVHRLKAQGGADLIAYGGASLASSLMDHQLVDELILLINPVALGNGMKIFNGRTHLKHAGTRTFDCGINVLIYNA